MKKTKTIMRTLFATMIIMLMISGCSKEKDISNKICIIGAMDEEVESLKKEVVNPKVSNIAGMEFCEGTLDGTEVVIVKSGIGKVNAGTCTQLAINAFGAKKVINTGVAGSLDASIDIGDIVVSTDAVQYDFDLSPIGYEKGQLEGMESASIPADEVMRKNAVDAVKKCAPEISVFEGRVCTGDQFISSDDQKKAITTAFGGLCCEMEGGAVAQICHRNNIPFVIIRAISDKADGSAEMSYTEFQHEAAMHCASIVQYMISNSEVTAD